MARGPSPFADAGDIMAVSLRVIPAERRLGADSAEVGVGEED
jgi:hypothetical protein